MGTSLRSLIVLSLSALLVAGAAPPMPEPATRPSTSASEGKVVSKAMKIAELEDYYARLYGQPLTQSNRFAKLIAVMSLSRIDGAALTKHLMTAVTGNDLIVAQLAWEALHARHRSLNAEDRTVWLNSGLTIAAKGGFAGAAISPLLVALAEREPGTLKGIVELLNRVAAESDVKTEGGKQTLEGARSAIAAWQDPKIVRGLLSRMTSRPQLFAAYAHMLGGLPGAPELSLDIGAAKSAWAKYERETKWSPQPLAPYTGKSSVFPEPERVENPDDPKWRKELELPSLKVERVEIAYCIDATPSMDVSNPYVATYVETISRLFGLMQFNVRSGAVYYRHEVDAAVMDECCRKWQKYSDGFAVKMFAMTDKPGDLVTQMRGMKVEGKQTGHAGAGAYCAGVSTAMERLTWTPGSRRVIAMTGDARLTPGSEPKLVELSKKAKADGISLIYIARDERAAKAVETASQAAMGMSAILYGNDIKKIEAASSGANVSAVATFHETAFEEMAVRVLQQSLPVGYRDRVRPLVDALSPILQANALVTPK